MSYNGQSLYSGLYVKASAVPDLNIHWAEGLFGSPYPNGGNPLTYVSLGSTLMTVPASGFEQVAILEIAGNDNAAEPVGSPLAGYALLAHSTITNVGSSVVNGAVDLIPGTSITGFPPGVINGAVNVNNYAASIAAASAQAQFTAMQTLGLAGSTIPASLDGHTYGPGAYQFTGGATTLAASAPATLILSGAGTYIFYTASTLGVGAGGAATVTLTGGATAANVFWIVGSSATLQNSGTVFNGNVVAQASVTFSTGGTYNGQYAALTGAISLAGTGQIINGNAATPGPVPAGTIIIKYGTPVVAGSGLSVYPTPDLDYFLLAELFTPAVAMQNSTTAVTNANISNLVLSAEFGGR